MSILWDSPRYHIHRKMDTVFIHDEEYPWEIESFYVINLAGRQVDLKMIEDKEDEFRDSGKFYIDYQGRHICNGDLKELKRITDVMKRTLEVLN